MQALLSVDDKTGLEALARRLVALGVELISTGGTAGALAAAGLPVREVAEVTGFPEILGGRVKTLHPAIAGGILARRDEPGDLAQLGEHGITPIDLVVCNLYPFERTVATPGVTDEEAIAKIDIGGVTLLRAAAKNFRDVTVLTHPDDYDAVLEELERDGHTTPETRRCLATRAFRHVARYDALIADYLREGTRDEQFPDELTLGLKRIQTLRYGENPHQPAAVYAWGVTPPPEAEGDDPSDAHGGTHNGHAPAPGMALPSRVPTVAGARVLQGKELSFNNFLDLDAALNAVASFVPPTTVVIKHTNPCGLACGDTLAESYIRAHAGDPVSAYGGIVGCNREIDGAAAGQIAEVFYEAIVAPGYSPEALDILGKKKNLRLLATDCPIGPASAAARPDDLHRMDVRRISGGLLVQTADVVTDRDVQCTVVSEREPTLEEVTDLLFAWKAVQHVKSNAIVLAKQLKVVGVGAGQTSRVYSVEIAVDRAGDRARGSVLASDAYFPFADGVETAAKAGVTAVIQPGGSIRDAESVRMANKYGMAMIVTGQRHFRH